MRMGCKIKWDFCSILMGSEYIYIFTDIHNVLYCSKDELYNHEALEFNGNCMGMNGDFMRTYNGAF
jgi:hypothetical protein